MRGTILVVHADPSVLEVLVRALEEDGYETCRGFDGVAALEVAAERHIDLVLTDVVLPRLDGVSLVHELRQREHYMPVIIVSGIRDGVDLSQTSLVSEPVDLSHVLTAVERMLPAAS